MGFPLGRMAPKIHEFAVGEGGRDRLTMVRWGQRHFPATVSPSVELLSLVAEDKRRKIREKKTLPSLVDAANVLLPGLGNW